MSQPTLRRGREKADIMGQGILLKGRKRAESPPAFIRGKRRKNQKNKGLRILKMRVWELFTHREGISTPTRPSQGTTASNRVCKT